MGADRIQRGSGRRRAAYPRSYVIFLVVLGSATLGFCSIAMPAMTSVVMSAVEPVRTGLASGILNTACQTRGALGVAMLGGLLTTSDNGAGTLPRVPMLAVIAAYVVAMTANIVHRPAVVTWVALRPRHLAEVEVRVRRHGFGGQCR